MVNKKKLRKNKNRAVASLLKDGENMGSQSNRGSASLAKLKKARRKEQLEKARRLKQIIDSANFEDLQERTPRNVLEEVFVPERCETWTKLRSGTPGLTISFHHGKTEDPGLADQIYALAEKNMKDLYLASGWSWGEKAKRRELFHEDARFVVLRVNDSGELFAFINFRMMMEGECPVLYVYELQVEEAQARNGIGRMLMKLVEEVAAKHHLEWVMLTCFQSNEASQSFYKKLDYRRDETSPQLSFEEFLQEDATSYDILSKAISPTKQ